MPTYEIIGLKHSKFIGKQDGNPVEGYNIYMTYEDKHINGLGVLPVFLSTSKLSGYTPAIGDLVEVNYDQYRHPKSLVKVS